MHHHLTTGEIALATPVIALVGVFVGSRMNGKSLIKRDREQRVWNERKAAYAAELEHIMRAAAFRAAAADGSQDSRFNYDATPAEWLAREVPLIAWGSDEVRALSEECWDAHVAWADSVMAMKVQKATMIDGTGNSSELASNVNTATQAANNADRKLRERIRHELLGDLA